MAILAAQNNSPPPIVITVPGADHMYAGESDEVASRMIDWLDGKWTAPL